MGNAKHRGAVQESVTPHTTESDVVLCSLRSAIGCLLLSPDGSTLCCEMGVPVAARHLS